MSSTRTDSGNAGGSAAKARESFLIVTCEHGGNRIPGRYGKFFKGKSGLLQSHRGWDPGALVLARKIASYCKAPFAYETVSRLLVEQNRSRNRATVFSEFSSAFPSDIKERILRDYYDPYHEKIMEFVNKAADRDRRAIHVSIHTFTPVLNGETRNACLGILYDPSRTCEMLFALQLRNNLHELIPSCKVRRNYPYKGMSDGVAAWLRKKFTPDCYCGIEIEVNQKHFYGRDRIWNALLSRMPKIIASMIR